MSQIRVGHMPKKKKKELGGLNNLKLKCSPRGVLNPIHKPGLDHQIHNKELLLSNPHPTPHPPRPNILIVVGVQGGALCIICIPKSDLDPILVEPN